jgi:hypothetical protein
MHGHVKNTLEGLLGQSRPNWYGAPGNQIDKAFQKGYVLVARI